MEQEINLFNYISIYGKNSNFGFSEEEDPSYLKTSSGKILPYKLFSADSDAGSNLLRQEGNNDYSNNFALVERRFYQNKALSFSAGEKINNVSDVAWLFRSLEDEAVEHTFLLYRFEDDSYLVQHLSTGDYTSGMVTFNLFAGNVLKMKPKSITLIHNHPSGNLVASRADINVLTKMKDFFEGTSIEVEDGIIINLRSGKYLTFNENTEVERPLHRQNQPQKDVKIYSFTKQVFSGNYQPFKIKGPVDAAAYISSQKFGISDRTEMLIINNANEITGKFILPQHNMVEKIVELLTIYGGVRGILLGNNVTEELLNNINKKLKLLQFEILDGFRFESNNYFSVAQNQVVEVPEEKDVKILENQEEDDGLELVFREDSEMYITSRTKMIEIEVGIYSDNDKLSKPFSNLSFISIEEMKSYLDMVSSQYDIDPALIVRINANTSAHLLTKGTVVTFREFIQEVEEHYNQINNNVMENEIYELIPEERRGGNFGIKVNKREAEYLIINGLVEDVMNNEYGEDEDWVGMNKADLNEDSSRFDDDYITFEIDITGFTKQNVENLLGEIQKFNEAISLVPKDRKGEAFPIKLTKTEAEYLLANDIVPDVMTLEPGKEDEWMLLTKEDFELGTTELDSDYEKFELDVEYSKVKIEEILISLDKFNCEQIIKSEDWNTILLQIPVQSHLSDALHELQTGHPELLEQAMNRISFVKKIISQAKGDLTSRISEDRLNEVWKQTIGESEQYNKEAKNFSSRYDEEMEATSVGFQIEDVIEEEILNKNRNEGMVDFNEIPEHITFQDDKSQAERNEVEIVGGKIKDLAYDYAKNPHSILNFDEETQILIKRYADQTDAFSKLSPEELLNLSNVWADELSKPTGISKGMSYDQMADMQAHYYREYEIKNNQNPNIMQNQKTHYDDALYSQAEGLPVGWEWQEYLDGSGSLTSPEGKEYFQYDKSTNEYKKPYDKNEWWEIPDYDDFDFSKYAENDILQNGLSENYLNPPLSTEEKNLLQKFINNQNQKTMENTQQQNQKEERKLQIGQLASIKHEEGMFKGTIEKIDEERGMVTLVDKTSTENKSFEAVATNVYGFFPGQKYDKSELEAIFAKIGLDKFKELQYEDLIRLEKGKITKNTYTVAGRGENQGKEYTIKYEPKYNKEKGELEIIPRFKNQRFNLEETPVYGTKLDENQIKNLKDGKSVILPRKNKEEKEYYAKVYYDGDLNDIILDKFVAKEDYEKSLAAAQAEKTSKKLEFANRAEYEHWVMNDVGMFENASKINEHQLNKLLLTDDLNKMTETLENAGVKGETIQQLFNFEDMMKLDDKDLLSLKADIIANINTKPEFVEAFKGDFKKIFEQDNGLSRKM